MEHKPVLLNKVVEILAPQEGEVFADLTAGYGGHAQSLLDRVGKNGRGYLYDQDETAVEYLQNKFSQHSNIVVQKSNFTEIDLAKIARLDMVLVDLGVSSPQLDNYARGFSFRGDGPLDMRMDSSAKLTAAHIVNTYSEKALADLIYAYGEEHRSRLIARAIINERIRRPIATTLELASVVYSVVPKHGKLDPATKTFQALRIAVNDEIENLRKLLPKVSQAISPGGRIAIISFHSLEDRVVKNFFRDICSARINDYGQIELAAQFHHVTKKAIKGDQFDTNPRARSARLRAVVKQI